MEESYGVDTEDMVGMPAMRRRGEHTEEHLPGLLTVEVSKALRCGHRGHGGYARGETPGRVIYFLLPASRRADSDVIFCFGVDTEDMVAMSVA